MMEFALEKGLALQRGNKFADAIKLYDNAISKYPKEGIFLFMKGICLYDLGEVYKAIPVFENAVKIQPDFTASLTGLGMCYFNIGDFAKAANNLEKILKKDPNNMNALIIASFTYATLGDKAKAKSYLARAAGIDKIRTLELSKGMLLGALKSKDLTEKNRATTQKMIKDMDAAIGDLKKEKPKKKSKKK